VSETCGAMTGRRGGRQRQYKHSPNRGDTCPSPLTIVDTNEPEVSIAHASGTYWGATTHTATPWRSVCAPSAAHHRRPIGKGGSIMAPRKQSRVRLSIEELESRTVPAAPPIGVHGFAAILGDHAHVGSVESAATHSHDRPFHLEESGAAAFNADGSISGN